MKYKTTIEIVSDAENKDEAAEIAGEYLSGNFMSGVGMKCVTRPVRSHNGAIVSVAVLSLMIVVGVFFGVQMKNTSGVISPIPGASAIQPQLKTSLEDKKSEEFKKKWQDKQAKEVLEYIKK